MPQNVVASIIMITRLVDPAVYIYGGWADPKYSIRFVFKLLLHCFFWFTYSGENINSSCQSSQDLLRQGTYSVHYSLYFIVYNILFTICTLLKLYTIGHVAGSGKKYKGYRFKTSQLSTKKTWSNGQLYPGLKTTSSQAGRCARHDTSNQVKI